MSAAILRMRLLGAIGSTGVLAGLSLAGCEVQSNGTDAVAGESGASAAGSGGSAGESSGDSGSGGSTPDGSGGRPTEPSETGGSSTAAGEAGTGALGGGVPGGGGEAGLGRDGDLGGEGGSGSSGAPGGSGGETEWGDWGVGCWGNSIGTCCVEDEVCFDPETAWEDVYNPPEDDVPRPPRDPDGPLCPSSDLSTGVCSGFEVSTHRDGLCCYLPWGGDCCGRPFVVAGEARVASVVRRSDWGLAA